MNWQFTAGRDIHLPDLWVKEAFCIFLSSVHFNPSWMPASLQFKHKAYFVIRGGDFS